MKFSDVIFKVTFTNSRTKTHVTLQELGDSVINFLEYYGEENILSRGFSSIIGDGDGETKFIRLLKAVGHETDSWSFFTELIQKLEGANSENVKSVKINDVELPYLLVLEILKVLIPGSRFYEVRSVRRLENLTNVRVPQEQREKLQEVLELFPVRLSLHTIRQMRISKAVAWQYYPFVDELNKEGMVHTWVGQFHRGIVEQMYQNRVIFILNMNCPVYCRFCFRKHKECRNQKSPTQEHIKEAVNYIRNSPSIKEIVLTGGDPFMNRATLTYAIDGLKSIPHVQCLRVATRSISYYPHLFYNKDSFWLDYLKRKKLELEHRGTRIEIATHFIHPDEISVESLGIIKELVSNGIPVYVQTPFVKDCNDDPAVLAQLFSQLRGAGAEIHYIYIPCSPIQGNRRYLTPISKGINVAAGLRAYLSDRAMPGIVTATSIGKIDWNSSGWAIEPDHQDEGHIWIRTPYTREYFEQFTPIMQFPDSVRINQEGNVEVKFMADIGDESLFQGKSAGPLFPPVTPPRKKDGNENENEDDEEIRERQIKNLKLFYATTPRDQRSDYSIVSTGSPSLFRPHIARVEMDIDASDEEMDYNLHYIAGNDRITDVILTARSDVIESIHKTGKVIERLHGINHVNAIRLRSYKFNYTPEVYVEPLIDRLGELNRLSITLPKRLEIETRFLHSSEFKPEHKKLVSRFAARGISVYLNTPLLGNINDSPEEILGISFNCRESGIEFQNLYFAGLPDQDYWNENHPSEISNLYRIASGLRKQGSGREIPRYLIQTKLGEVDFGLTSRAWDVDEEGYVKFKLLPYVLDYYRKMDQGYEWPEDVLADQDGHPIISVPGIIPNQPGAIDSEGF